MAHGQETLVVQQPGAVGMRVQVGGVADVVAHLLQPADVILVPAPAVAGELTGSVPVRVRTIEGDFGRPYGAGGRHGSAVAVELVEAFPRTDRVVVVGLVGRDALLVEQVGGTG